MAQPNLKDDKPNTKQNLVRMAVPPALIALISAFHPSFSTNAADGLARIESTRFWEAIHFALLVAVLAFDASLLGWKPFPRGKLSAIRIIGAWLNAGFYAAFIGVDGFASAVLSRTLPPNLAQEAVTSLFASPLIGALGWVGGAGWILSAAAIIRQRQVSGLAIGPSILLIVGTVWLFASHAPPFGVIAGVLIASGATWAALEKAPS